MKLLFSLLIAAATLLSACTQQPQAAAGKPKYLWFDASANYQRFMQRDSIDYYLDKARYAGFNNVVVDVRGVDGEALYPSQVIPHKNDRDWDYLEYFITAAHSRGMKVMVGTTIFTAGSPRLKRGPAYYENSPLKGRTCQLYLPEGMICNDDYTNDVSTFLIPSMPENQEYALSFIKELTERYDIDGYSLDYCRYPGVASDFSEFSRRDFEKYLGHEVENWPEDIYTFPKEGWPLTPGKYYKQWWTYRSKVISDFVARATQTIKSIKPHVEVSYWAAGRQFTQGAHHRFEHEHQAGAAAVGAVVHMVMTVGGLVARVGKGEAHDAGLARFFHEAAGQGRVEPLGEERDKVVMHHWALALRGLPPDFAGFFCVSCASSSASAASSAPSSGASPASPR